MCHSVITIIHEIKLEKARDERDRLWEIDAQIAAGNCPEFVATEFYQLHFFASFLFEDEDKLKLLVEFNVDGSEQEFFTWLSVNQEKFASRVFGSCVGYPEKYDSQRLRKFLNAGAQPTQLHHIGNTGRQLKQVKNELKIFTWLTSWLADSSHYTAEVSSRSRLWDKLDEDLRRDKEVGQIYEEAVTNFRERPFLVRFNPFYKDSRAALAGVFGHYLKLALMVAGLISLLFISEQYLSILVVLILAITAVKLFLNWRLLPRHLKPFVKIKAYLKTCFGALKEGISLLAGLALLTLILSNFSLTKTSVLLILTYIYLLLAIVLMSIAVYLVYLRSGLLALAITFLVLAVVSFSESQALPLPCILVLLLLVVFVTLIASWGFLLSAIITTGLAGLQLVRVSLDLSGYLPTVAQDLPWNPFLWSLGLLACALLTIILGILRVLFKIRQLETVQKPLDSDIASKQLPQRVGAREDMQFQNHLATVTDIIPGPLRRQTLYVVMRSINLLGRLIENRRFLGTIATIHFARFMIYRDRLIFIGNYDGSWGAYLGDFHGAEGLTAIWSNTQLRGVANFPRSLALFFRGAQRERRFKRYSRNAQVETLIWYSAYPGRSTLEIFQATETCEFLHRLENSRRMDSRHPLIGFILRIFTPAREVSDYDMSVALERLV